MFLSCSLARSLARSLLVSFANSKLQRQRQSASFALLLCLLVALSIGKPFKPGVTASDSDTMPPVDFDRRRQRERDEQEFIYSLGRWSCNSKWWWRHRSERNETISLPRSLYPSISIDSHAIHTKLATVGQPNRGCLKLN